MFTLDLSQTVMTIVVICLILWRISYGKNNGLFAEAAGLIAVIASFIATYYTINVLMKLVTIEFGGIIYKICYLFIAFVVYKIMTSIANAFRKIKNIPIVGKVDRFLGAILGIVEAVLIVKLVEYITDIAIFENVFSVCYEIIVLITKSFIKK